MLTFDLFQDPARAAQEKYDQWVCTNGTPAQRLNVGKRNGSRVQCNDDDAIRAAQADVEAKRQAIIDAQNAYRSYPKMSPGVAPPLNVPSRANQKANIFTKKFDPRTRKIIILVIASFLIFLAFVNYD